MLRIKIYYTATISFNEFILTLFFPVFPFDSPENIIKPTVLCFQGDQRVHWEEKRELHLLCSFKAKNLHIWSCRSSRKVNFSKFDEIPANHGDFRFVGDQLTTFNLKPIGNVQFIDWPLPMKTETSIRICR